MKKSNTLLALLVAAGLFAGTACAQVTLKAVSFLPKNHPVMVGSVMWVNAVNAGLKGEVGINYIGGPEAVPRPQQVEALSNKVVDVALVAASEYFDQIPAGATFTLSQLTPTEERKSGYHAYMVDAHKKIHARYLGRMYRSSFYLWVKRAPGSLADLRGLKLRTGALYDRMMQAFGIVPVNVAPAEVYTALDSGLVDGFGWPTAGARQQGWIKRASYVIDLPFYEASNGVILVNLERWNALKPELQRKLEALTADIEPKIVSLLKEQDNAEWIQLEKAGVKRVRFSDAENKKYLDTAYDVEWKALEAKLGADEIGKLRKLTGN